MKYNYALIGCLIGCLVCSPDILAANLSASVVVNQTSDTAANAKTEAINMARRQILAKVLSNYTESDNLNDLLQETPSDELVNLIASSSVSNEQISSDTYSANISMVLDNEMAKNWLVAHEIPNWVPNAETTEHFSMFIVVSNGLSDWAELKRIARESGTNLDTQNLNGNQIYAKMPSNQRAKFTAAIHQMGWRYTDNDGVLRIWK